MPANAGRTNEASCGDCRHLRDCVPSIYGHGVCAAPGGLHAGRIMPTWQGCPDFEEGEAGRCSVCDCEGSLCECL